MTLFLLLIWCVGWEFRDVVDSIHQLSLSIQWRFQVQQGLCFRWWFMTIPCVSHNSIFAIGLMSRSSINWRCQFHTSAVIQFSVTISMSTETLFLTIPCVSQDSIFAIDFMRHSWIHWCCRLHTSAIIQYSLMISRSTVYCVFAGDLWISRDITFFTFPYVSHDSIFANDWMRCSWIQWHCPLHTSAVIQYSLTISRSTVTVFSLTLYGSPLT
jgi:hypothetical protein